MSAAAGGYRRLLVPVDFSPASAQALSYALALGDRFASTVDALHVWRTNTETQVSSARERAREQLRDFTSSMGPRGGATLRRRTDYGDPYLSILRVAQLASYDLLVVPAPRGGNGQDHLGLGLTHATRVPVLLVPSMWTRGRPGPELERHLQRILLPAVFAGRSPRAAEQAFALAETFSAVVEVLFVKDSRAESEQARCSELLLEHAAWQTRSDRRELELPLEAALERRADEGGYDLAVVAAVRGVLDQRGGDASLSRIIEAQRCPTLCERWG